MFGNSTWTLFILLISGNYGDRSSLFDFGVIQSFLVSFWSKLSLSVHSKPLNWCRNWERTKSCSLMYVARIADNSVLYDVIVWASPSTGRTNLLTGPIESQMTTAPPPFPHPTMSSVAIAIWLTPIVGGL